MLHEIRTGLGDRHPRKSLLSARERDTLAAVARATMPEGRFFAGGGMRAVDKVDQFLALSPENVGRGYRAILVALDAWALATHRTRLAALPTPSVLALLERWRHGDFARRTMV